MNPGGKIKRLQSAHQFFLMTLKATPEDRLPWRPGVDAGGDATSILEQAKHCIAAEANLRMLIQHGGMPPGFDGMPDDWATAEAFGNSGPAAGAATVADLEGHIVEQESLTSAMLEGLTEEDWASEISMPWMSGPRTAFVKILVDHWTYHAGAVAYIQRLYGDLRFGLEA